MVEAPDTVRTRQFVNLVLQDVIPIQVPGVQQQGVLPENQERGEAFQAICKVKLWRQGGILGNSLYINMPEASEVKREG